MSRFRCFDTYNLTQSTSSDRTTDVKRKTILQNIKQSQLEM